MRKPSGFTCEPLGNSMLNINHIQLHIKVNTEYLPYTVSRKLSHQKVHVKFQICIN